MKPLLLFLVTEDWAFLSHRLPMAKAAQEAGYDVAVACRVREKQAEIEQLGYTVYPLAWRRSGNSVFSHLWAIWQIFVLYCRLKPKVIHHVALKAILFGMIAGFFSRAHIVNGFTGLGFAFSQTTRKAKIIKFGVLCVLQVLLLRGRVRHIFQNQDDQHTLRLYKNAVIIPGSGIDCQYFTPNRTGDARTRVMMVARALKDKGTFEFFEAARLLKSQGVEADFVFVGEPDHDNPNALSVSEWQRVKDEKNVDCWGQRTDVRECWWQCDIAVLPSYREGLPKSLLEAAACGKAIITTHVPGCQDMVQDGKNGFLVEAKNVEQLAAAIQTLLTSIDKVEAMGKVSRQRALSEWSTDVIQEKMKTIYRRY